MCPLLSYEYIKIQIACIMHFPTTVHGHSRESLGQHKSEMQVQHWHFTLHSSAGHTTTLSHSWVFPRRTDSIFWLSSPPVLYIIPFPVPASRGQCQRCFVQQRAAAHRTSSSSFLSSWRPPAWLKIGLKNASPQSAEPASCPAPSTQHTCR